MEKIENRDNVSRFKEILLELHRGAKPFALFDEFHDIIANADFSECEEIRKQLVIEGVPKKRAIKWSRSRLLSKYKASNSATA